MLAEFARRLSSKSCSAAVVAGGNKSLSVKFRSLAREITESLHSRASGTNQRADRVQRSLPCVRSRDARSHSRDQPPIWSAKPDVVVFEKMKNDRLARRSVRSIK
jgi:hypothetical protein